MSEARRFLLLLNPAAGGGRERELLPRIEAAMGAAGLQHRAVLTTGLEHGCEEARAAERRGDLAEAVRLQEWALALFRELYPAKKFPDGHPDLARSLQDLGVHYSLRGQPQ